MVSLKLPSLKLPSLKLPFMARGKSRACLYTDLGNRFANRCYRRIGFKPWCRSYHIDVEG